MINKPNLKQLLENSKNYIQPKKIAKALFLSSAVIATFSGGVIIGSGDLTNTTNLNKDFYMNTSSIIQEANIITNTSNITLNAILEDETPNPTIIRDTSDNTNIEQDNIAYHIETLEKGDTLYSITSKYFKSSPGLQKEYKTLQNYSNYVKSINTFVNIKNLQIGHEIKLSSNTVNSISPINTTIDTTKETSKTNISTDTIEETKSFIADNLQNVYHIKDKKETKLIANALENSINVFYPENKDKKALMLSFYSQILLESSGKSNQNVNNSIEDSTGLSQVQVGTVELLFNNFKHTNAIKTKYTMECIEFFHHNQKNYSKIKEKLKDPEFNIFVLVAFHKYNTHRLDTTKSWHKEDFKKIIDLELSNHKLEDIKNDNLVDIVVNQIPHNGDTGFNNYSILKTGYTEHLITKMNEVFTAANNHKQTLLSSNSVTSTRHKNS